MQYRIKSHPTEYKNVLFRSRLEARWAAFFDLSNLKWEYEPLDLQGSTPDFRVSVPTIEDWEFCEVKPYELTDWLKNWSIFALRAAQAGIGSIDLLGTSPENSSKVIFIPKTQASNVDGSFILATDGKLEGYDLWGHASVCCSYSDEENKKLWAKAGYLTMYQRPR